MVEGQNPIFLHHCEGAPGPVPGEIFAAQKSQAILDGSGTSQPLIIITPFVYRFHSFLPVFCSHCWLSDGPNQWPLSSAGGPCALLLASGDLQMSPLGTPLTLGRELPSCQNNQNLHTILLAIVTHKIGLSPISPERGLPVVTFSTPTVLEITNSISGSN